jgi:general secretion pathway protein A
MSMTARPVPAEATRAFQPTADRSSLWLVGQYDDALRILRAAVLGRQGLLLLAGEPGTGKTMLAHALSVRVREEHVVVGRLPYPILEGMDLLGAVAEAFGLPADFKDRAAFLEQFSRFVVAMAASGRRVVLVADEAHSLTSERLVELARLPQGEGADEPASMSVLMIGQRGLIDRLRADGVEADILCHLRPLTREQTADYIAHRLRAAGHRGRLFTPSALRKIWVVSEGVPRTINTLCVEALTDLRRGTQRKVTAGMIDRSPREQDDRVAADAEPFAAAGRAPGTPGERAEPKRLRARVAVAAALVISVGTAWMLIGRLGPHSLSTPPASATAPATVGLAAEPGTASRASEQTRAEAVASEGSRVPAAPALGEMSAPAVVSAARPAGLRPDVVARQPRAEAAPGGQPVHDSLDGSAAIDWLLKGSRR